MKNCNNSNMSNDSFKFRVWNKLGKYYEPEQYLKLTQDGYLRLYHDSIKFPLFGTESEHIVERCTGLKDVNGKLIFEGDVVNMYIPCEDNYRKCVVQYVIDEGTAQWLAVYLEGRRYHMLLGIVYDITAEYLDGSYCTVIGNIHDDQFREVTKMVGKERK